MNNLIVRNKTIEKLVASFNTQVDRFPESIRYSALSMLALSILEVTESDLAKLAPAIEHITLQNGISSYLSLNEQQRLCVNIFASQLISQQEHIVYSQKNYLDTLRINDASLLLSETNSTPVFTTPLSEFTSGFVTQLKVLGNFILSLVSSKPGSGHE
jgi:hypothetical protein